MTIPILGGEVNWKGGSWVYWRQKKNGERVDTVLSARPAIWPISLFLAVPS
jgi:hypothetical protein